MQESLQQQGATVSRLLEQNQLPPSLVRQASRLQVSRALLASTATADLLTRLLHGQEDLDGALGRWSRQWEEARSSEELQRLHRRLVGSLEELLALGSRRLEQRPQRDVRDVVELQQQYCNHTVSTATPRLVARVGMTP